MTQQILKKLVDKALKTLRGEWLIMGGTVLPLVGAEYRSTADIDMVPIGGDDNDTTLALMELADSLDLPVESINPAGLFFLKKLRGWRERLVLHAHSKTCRIYRPSFDLFLELKLGRFSESDESDIHAYLDWHREQSLPIDAPMSLTAIEHAAQDVKRNTELSERYDRLRRAIQRERL